MDRINFIGKSRNTIENFKEIQELDLKYSETILITSAYHMKRSMMIAKRQGLEVIPYPVNPISRDTRAFCNDSLKFLPIAIASPTDIIDVPKIASVSENFSKVNLGIFVTT